MEDTMEFVIDASQSFVESFNSKDNNDNDKMNLITAYLQKLFQDKDLIKVKDFRSGLEWMNTEKPLSLHRDLKGKIIVLDFFTYCCINCMHILPDLKALEDAYPVERGLVVIGVHSAKFLNERNTQNILDAVKRYEINHPVVNDVGEQMWNQLCVCCWPTMVVIGPDLRPLLVLQGEGHRSLLFSLVEKAIDFYKKKGILSNHSLHQIKVTRAFNSSKLFYPGKISSRGSDITLSDSGNHRVIHIKAFGSDKENISLAGGVVSGFKDGSLEDARFHSPQGVAFLDDDTIIVADTENHALRKIDLKSRRVETLSGTGVQGFDRIGGKKGKNQTLSSPWDVCLNSSGTIVYIAMAGLHQIWAYFLKDATLWGRSYERDVCVAIAGNGREENRNNVYPMSSAFAQPSGICLAEEANTMFIADSESSSIRAIDMSNGRVKAVVGGARDPHNLFAFGDKDGVGIEAQLQHPLGVASNDSNGKLYVADTYNHKIKEINIKTNSCQSLIINHQLKEPAGLCFFGGKLLIANTNNHEFLKCDLESGKVETVDLSLKPCKPSAKRKNVLAHDTLAINPKGGTLEVNTALTLPSGCAITKEAPSRWILSAPDHWTVINGSSEEFRLTERFKFQIPEQSSCARSSSDAVDCSKLENSPSSESNGVCDKPLIIDCIVYYCTPSSTCGFEEVSVLLSVVYEKDAKSNLTYDILHEVKSHILMGL